MSGVGCVGGSIEIGMDMREGMGGDGGDVPPRGGNVSNRPLFAGRSKRWRGGQHAKDEEMMTRRGDVGED